MNSKLKKALRKVDIDSLLERFIDWYSKTIEEIKSKKDDFIEQAQQERLKICNQLGYEDDSKYSYYLNRVLRGKQKTFSYKFEDEDIVVVCNVEIPLSDISEMEVDFDILINYPQQKKFSGHSFGGYPTNLPDFLENYDVSVPVALGIISGVFEFAKSAIRDIKGCITLVKLICIASVFSYIDYAKNSVYYAPLNRKAMIYFCKKAVYISIYELGNLLKMLKRFSLFGMDFKIYYAIVKSILKKRYILL